MTIPITSTADMVTVLVIVNLVAMLVLGVMAYVGSAVALNCLEAWDRRLDPSQRERMGQPELDGTSD